MFLTVIERDEWHHHFHWIYHRGINNEEVKEKILTF